MINGNELKRYIQEVLGNAEPLKKYLSYSSIILIEEEENIVWDIMIFMPDDMFLNDFSKEWGDCFVLDDHSHEPWVFTRVKNYGWLADDFAKRLPIALWIFGNSDVIQDANGVFSALLEKKRDKFNRLVKNLIAVKYIELRSERHNLRHALQKERKIASRIIKATIAKVSLELCFLSEKKPYPYKKLLPERALIETINGREILSIVERFLESDDREEEVIISDGLIQKIIDILKLTGIFPNGFLEKWWLHLK
jgi:hypothetical protein